MSPALNPPERIAVTGEHESSATETFVSGWLPSFVSVYVNVTDCPMNTIVALAALLRNIDDMPTGSVIGAIMTSNGPVVVTAPFDRILPFMTTVLPKVIAASLSMFPAKILSSPSVVPPAGTQNTLLACAPPFSATAELAKASSAPVILKR